MVDKAAVGHGTMEIPKARGGRPWRGSLEGPERKLEDEWLPIALEFI
jgi:hypothetical protein